MRRVWAAAALLLAAALVAAEPDYYAPAAVLAFADHLFQQGDYLRAGYEYERYLFAPRQAGEASSLEIEWAGADELARQRAGLAFRCAGDFRRALGHFQTAYEAASSEPARERAAAEIGLTFLHLGEAAGSLRFVQEQPGWADSGRLRGLAAGDLILLGRFQEALAALGNAPGSEAQQLRDLARRGAGQAQKSAALAAVLSAVIPGAGKIYAGEFGDGVHSLLLVGALATLAGFSFRADGVDSWRGWLYVSLGGVLHAGNIYGSAVSARRHNQRQEETLRADVLGLLPPCSLGVSAGAR